MWRLLSSVVSALFLLVVVPVPRMAAGQPQAAPSIGDPLPSESRSWDGAAADLDGDGDMDLVVTRHHSNNAYLASDDPPEWLKLSEMDTKCNLPDGDPCTYPFRDMEDGVWLRKNGASAPWTPDDFELAVKFGDPDRAYYRDRHGCAVGNLDRETLNGKPFANDIVCAAGAGSGTTTGKPFEVYIGDADGTTVSYSNQTEYTSRHGKPSVGWGFDSRCDYCRGRSVVLTDYDADGDDDVIVVVKPLKAKKRFVLYDHDGDGATAMVAKSSNRVLENIGGELVWDHDSNFDQASNAGLGVAGHCIDTLNLFPANDSRLDLVTCGYDGSVTVWRANASVGDLTDKTRYHLRGKLPTWHVVAASDDWIVGSNENSGVEIWGRKAGTNQQYEWKRDVDAGTGDNEIDGFVARIEVNGRWAYVTIRGEGDTTSLLDTCGNAKDHGYGYDYKPSVIVRLTDGKVFPMPVVAQGCPGSAVGYGSNWFLTLNGWTKTIGPVEFHRYDTR